MEKMNLLICDDEWMIRESIVQTALSMEEFNVFTAVDVYKRQGWFIQKQDVAFLHQPFCNDYLLLVPSGQVLYLDIYIRSRHMQLLAIFFGVFLLQFFLYHAAFDDFVYVYHTDIFLDRHNLH